MRIYRAELLRSIVLIKINFMMMIIAKLIEPVINRTLRLDPESWEKLPRYSGKIVAVTDPVLNITLYFIFRSDGITVSADKTYTADTIITGTPFGLLQFYKQMNQSTAVTGSPVKISGDLELGEQLRDWLNALEIDIAEPLSKIVGDNAAQQIMSNAQRVFKWLGKAQTSLSQDLTEYLQEEARYLPSRLELNEFLNDVDGIRDDVERAAARLHQLTHAMKE